MEWGNYLLKSVAILTIFYAVYYVLLRKDTLFTVKRHYLLGGILAALFLPFLEFTRIIYKDAPVYEKISFSNIDPATSEITILQDEVFTVDWWQVALVIYSVGVLIMAVRFLIQLFSLLNLIRTYPSEKRDKYTFVKVEEAISPFSFFRNIVYNPQSHSKEELQMILKHEQVHASQWHSVDIVVAHALRILQWINPLSWFYKKSLEENLEFIADNKTAAQVPSAKQYQLTLVKAASPLFAPALTTQFYQSFIKKRIIMLNKSTSKKRNVWKLGIVLPALALFLWSFNVKEVVEYKEDKNTTEANKASEQVLYPNMTSENTDSKLNMVKDKPEEDFIEKYADKEEIGIVAGGGNASFRNEQATSMHSESKLLKADRSGLTTGLLKEVRIKITKNTTDAELEAMKANLKQDHGIDIDYSVKRNARGEIISIEFSYSGDDSSGSYNIEDDEAIEDFNFYIDEDGRSGFYSEGMEERRAERMSKRKGERDARMIEREVEMEKRRGEMDERRAEMEYRRAEMEGRRAKMDERRVEMEVRQADNAKRMYKSAKDIQKINKDIKKVNKTIVRSGSDEENTFVYSYDDNVFKNAVSIDKDTTDKELNKLKEELATDGITFNYSKVKRNGQGEITRIKITTDNNKGRKSTISIVGDDGEPIEEVIIEM